MTIWFLAYLAVCGWLAAVGCWLDARAERRWREKAMAGWEGANRSWKRVVDDVVSAREQQDAARAVELAYLPADAVADAKYWRVH